MAHLDANAGVPLARPALAAWLVAASAPADAAVARATAAALARDIARECRFELENAADENSYAAAWTAGGGEANCAIITGAVRRYAAATRRLPHVVTCAGEPASVLACCRALAAERACELTVLPIGRDGELLGRVDPARVGAALRENTCLVTISAANADTGAVNDLRAIVAAVRTGTAAMLRAVELARAGPPSQMVRTHRSGPAPAGRSDPAPAGRSDFMTHSDLAGRSGSAGR